jgi:hypothetical protein
VVHLGAFKSQLVETIAHIYIFIFKYTFIYIIYIFIFKYTFIYNIYIYLDINIFSCLVAHYRIQFPMDHYNDPILV